MFVAFVAEPAVVAVVALPVNAPTNVVDVTLDNPAIVVADDPKLIAVDPTVMLLFVSCAFPIPDSVPPNVIVPVLVIVPPVKVIPLTEPAVATEVTPLLTTLVAQDAVPCNDPVNPAVAITLPVTCTVEPEAKIKFDLEPSAVPFPTINAD